jgi:hypothetical protein
VSDTDQATVTCPSCGSVVAAGLRRCDHCGTRLKQGGGKSSTTGVLAERRRILAARRSLVFACLPIAVYLLVTLLDVVVPSASYLVSVAASIASGASLVIAVVLAVGGLRHTGEGAAPGRGRAQAALVIVVVVVATWFTAAGGLGVGGLGAGGLGAGGFGAGGFGPGGLG